VKTQALHGSKAQIIGDSWWHGFCDFTAAARRSQPSRGRSIAMSSPLATVELTAALATDSAEPARVNRPC
jgi:hypothetical protein